MIDITAAAIATVISSTVAATVAIRINRGNSRKSLNDQLDGIIKISIQYPYLESPAFTSTWTENRNSEEDKYLRYELYCILVFNFIERLCKFYKYDKKKIAQHVNIRDWVRIHEQNWRNPSNEPEHRDGYCEKVKELVDDYLNE